MSGRAKPIIALTLGDIAGIGPEITAKVLSNGPSDDYHLLVVDDAGVLEESLRRLGITRDLPIVDSADDLSTQAHHVAVLDLSHTDNDLLSFGKPHPGTGKMAAKALALALGLAMDGKVDGVVYPPLCKDTLDAGDGRHGDELELLRSVTNAPQMVRFAKIGNVLRTSVTGHIPFRDVADMVTTDSVLAAIGVLQEAASSYGMEKPRIAVAALNPHGGESGQIGREEIDAINPAVEAARSKGIDTYGPLPADTIYVRALNGEFDGVVSLYHDQGNIAAKVAGFGEGVVLYTRSPVIVATVAHGVAFDIAGKGVADPANLRQVIEDVAALAKRRFEA
jgi:4-hydroxythreonine-4-phosphate dehydrogenase